MAPSAQAEPLAIIGLACRFPQDAKNVEGLWQCLLAGRSMATRIPKEKINTDGHYHPDPEHGGSIYMEVGHFLADSVATFDPPFFNLSKNDILAMDPQQRLVLENTYQALENSGLKVEDIVGTATSVFVGGGFVQDFLHGLNQDTEMITKNKATGTGASMLANRVSWFYDLKGTSMAIDTACSSSLVALHQACQDLRSGQSDMTIVSGVNLIDFPGTTMALGGLGGILSRDGKCFSFDHRANGYGRGEGVGTVIVKPLNAALRDKNTIRAIIRATGSNQDGRTPGIAVPSMPAQESLIRHVYASAGLDMSHTRYFEAHGTGTPTGDTIEAGAIAAAFNSSASNDQPLYIGSIKANIGHLEAAAGIAGVIKAVLMVEKGVIPPAANFEKPNAKVPLQEWNMRIATSPVPWPTAGVRRVSVNSFGFGGANAHAVLDDAYIFLKGSYLDTPNAAIITQDESCVHSNGVSLPSVKSSPYTAATANELSHGSVFIISTADEAGIQRNAVKLSQYLRSLSTKRLSPSAESQYLTDLAYTLATKRSMFKWKAFCIAASQQDLIANLQGQVSKPVQKARYAPKLGFVFTGQGAQWPSMGRALGIYPLYRLRIEEASTYMTLLGSPWSLKDVLLECGKSAADINDPFLSQAACAAIQVALVDLLSSWNIVPARVIGHSSGEIAAAYCAGNISRKDVWKLAYFRGFLSATQMNRRGAMAAVGISPQGILPYLEALREPGEPLGELVIACYNSPKNITISGDDEKIDLLCAALEKDKIFARKLAVRNAYHSPQMEVLADNYRTLIGELSGTPDRDTPPKEVEMISSVTAQSIKQGETGQAEYWVKNLVLPVRFSDALLVMASSKEKKSGQQRLRLGLKSEDISVQHIVEIGPHSALRSAIRDTLSTKKELAAIEYHNLLTRNDFTTTSILSTAATLYCHSYPVGIEAVNPHIAAPQGIRPPQMLTDLPPYEFNHTKSYWKESRLSKNYRLRRFPRHGLFGAPVADWNPSEPKWRGFLRLSELPWIKDHKITGNYIFPGVGYLVMAIEASKQIADGTRTISGFRLQDISIKAALNVPDTPDGVEYILSMSEVAETNRDRSQYWSEFRVWSSSGDGEDWTEHCSGLIMVEYDTAAGKVDNGREAVAEANANAERLVIAESMCQKQLDINAYYEALKEIGMAFGPTFRNVSDARLGDSRGNVLGKGNALSNITVPDITKCMPKHFQHPHIIHPATLDSILQTFMIAILDAKKTERVRQPELPTFMKTVWVSTSLTNEPGSKLQCYSQTEQISPTQYKTRATVWDAKTRQMILTLAGIETKPLLIDTGDTSGTSNHLCHFVEWQPAVDLLSKGSTVFQNMISGTSFDLEAHRAHLKRCQLLSIFYIAKALEAVENIDTSCLKIHHRKYLEWMRRQAARISQPKSLPHQDPAALKSLLGNEDKSQRFFSAVHQPSAREELMHRLGPQLKPILCGEVDALEVMFTSGDLMERFYAESSAPGNIMPLLKSFLKALGHNSTNLRVIEIGAGTGSATMPILEVLSPQPASSLGDDSETSLSRVAHYTYTDVSAGFFKQAKEKFGNWGSLMEFKMLDIESSPAEQGFEVGTYDLVVASNVVHATSRLANALANSRSLLKSGGKLLLVESVQPNWLSTSFSFGLLPGWWLSSEPFRADGPLISEAQWDKVLGENGFSGLDLVLRDAEEEDLHDISVIVSTGNSDNPPAGGIEAKQHALVICESPEQMEQQLTMSLIESLTVRGFKSCTAIDYHSIPSANVDVKGSLCVALLGLGKTNLSEINENEFDSIKVLLLNSSWLVWVSGDEVENPALAMVTGLIRTVRWERDLDAPNLVLLGVDNPPPESKDLADKIGDYCKHYSKERNEEFLIKNNEFWAPRVRESALMTCYLDIKAGRHTPSLQALGEKRALRLTTQSPGMLNKLVFEDDPAQHTPLADMDVEVKIEAAGVNFKDVVIAMGQLAENSMGLEAAGEVTQVGSKVKHTAVGDRVATFAAKREAGCFQTFFRVHESAVVKVPPQMTLDEAAAIPLAFMTVLYSLNHVAKLSSGETILIHAAAGGVGQAAIQVAQLAGAEIFATVSTAEKRDWLVTEYGIAEERIFSSRDLSFVKGIKRMTQDRGVDVVLNSLSGEALRRSWDCIAPFGRFIELGKKDTAANGRLQMAPFQHNAMYYGMDMAEIMWLKPRVAVALIKEAFNLFVQGKIHTARPLTNHSYADVEKAFRQLQSGQAMGKIILKPHTGDIVRVLPQGAAPFRFASDVSYLLVGGLGGLGRSVARWMHSKGAKNFVFFSRSGAASNQARALIEELEKVSCRVKVCICDAGNLAQLRTAIAECRVSMPPIKGCIYGAMVLWDSMFVNMTYQQYQAAVGPKVRGSWGLQAFLDKDLDFFVMLSSITSIVGNRGQANYAAGNAYQDALARQLVSRGVKAVSINLGTIKSVGYVAENYERVQKQGEIFTQWDGISEEQLHSIIEYHIDPRVDFTGQRLRSSTIAGLMTAPSFTKKGFPLPAFMSYPLFKQLHAADLSVASVNEETDFPIQKLLRSCHSLDAATKYVEKALQHQITNMMSVPKEEFDPHKPLQAYGVDSLVAVEIRAWISKSMGADVAILDILSRCSILEFSAKVAGLSSMVLVTKLGIENEAD